MKLTELKEKKLADLKEIAKTLKIEKLSSMSKDDLVDAISAHQKSEAKIDKKEVKKPESGASEKMAAGVLEILPDGYGFLRSVNDNYLPGPEDIYVSPSQIKRTFSCTFTVD